MLVSYLHVSVELPLPLLLSRSRQLLLTLVIVAMICPQKLLKKSTDSTNSKNTQISSENTHKFSR